MTLPVVLAGETACVRLRLINDGTDSASVLGWQTSCNCTAVEEPPEIIAAKSEVEIPVEIDRPTPGRIEVALRFVFAGTPRQIVFRSIATPLIQSSNTIELVDGRAVWSIRKNHPVEITHVRSADRRVRWSLGRQTRQKLTVDVNGSDLPAAGVSTRVKIRFEDDREVVQTVQLTRRGWVKVSPRLLFFRNGVTRGFLNTRETLVEGAIPVKVSCSGVDTPMTLTILGDRPPYRFELRGEPPPGSHNIEISFDSLTVPLSIRVYE